MLRHPLRRPGKHVHWKLEVELQLTDIDEDTAHQEGLNDRRDKEGARALRIAPLVLKVPVEAMEQPRRQKSTNFRADRILKCEATL